VLCLDLSEPGQHTSGLLHDEWRFVPVPEAVGDWPVVFVLTHADSLTREEINAWYGPDAALRARPDAPAVQLCLTPEAEFEMAIPPGDDLSDEERAALHASLDRAADDAEAGRMMDLDEYLKEYRVRRATPEAEFEIAIPPGDDLSDEERAALHASLERALDDSDAGRGVDAFEYLREYRARLANHTS
jgi:hypothetical protein